MKLPQIISDVGIPSTSPMPRYDPDRFAAPMEGAARAAQGFQRQALDMMDREQKEHQRLLRQAQATEALSVQSELFGSFSDHEVKLENSDDPFTMHKSWNEGIDKITQDRLKQVKDPEIKRLVTDDVLRYKVRRGPEIVRHANKQIEAQNQAKLFNAIDDLAAQAASAGTAQAAADAPGGLQMAKVPPLEHYVARIEGALAVAQQAGYLSPEQARKKREEVYGKLAHSRALNDIERDPAGFLAAMKDPADLGHYVRNLGPVRVEGLQEKARNLLKHRNAENDARLAREEKKRDDALKGDAKAFMARVEEHYGDDSEMAPNQRLPREYFESGLRAFETILGHEDQKAVRRMLNRERREGGAADPNIYNMLLTQLVERPEFVTELDIRRRLGSGLNVAQYKELTLLREQRQNAGDVSHNTFYQDGVRQITILFNGGVPMPPGMSGMFAPMMEPEMARKYGAVLRQFDTYARSVWAKGENRSKPEVLRGLVDYAAALANSAIGGQQKPAQSPSAKPTAPGASAPQLPDRSKTQGPGYRRTLP